MGVTLHIASSKTIRCTVSAVKLAHDRYASLTLQICAHSRIVLAGDTTKESAVASQSNVRGCSVARLSDHCHSLDTSASESCTDQTTAGCAAEHRRAVGRGTTGYRSGNHGFLLAGFWLSHCLIAAAVSSEIPWSPTKNFWK